MRKFICLILILALGVLFPVFYNSELLAADATELMATVEADAQQAVAALRALAKVQEPADSIRTRAMADMLDARRIRLAQHRQKTSSKQAAITDIENQKQAEREAAAESLTTSCISGCIKLAASAAQCSTDISNMSTSNNTAAEAAQRALKKLENSTNTLINKISKKQKE